MSRTIFFVALFLSLCFITAKAKECPSRNLVFTVFRATGPDRDGLLDFVRKFNRALGNPNNLGRPGPLEKGRRFIRWDNIGFLPSLDFSGDLRNTVGVKVTTKDGKFLVGDPKGKEFNGINPRSKMEFKAYSPKDVFTPRNHNEVGVDFSIPGSDTAALVRGFGAVYVDVDEPRVTSATYLDRNGCVLAELFVDPRDRGLSFLGVIFETAVIAEVKLKLGDVPFAGTGTHSGDDAVVLDNFFYSEPQEIKH